MPRSLDDPPVILHWQSSAFVTAGMLREATETTEQAAAHHRADPFLQYDLMTLRASQQRWPEALAIGARLHAIPDLRAPVARTASQWIAHRSVPPELLESARSLTR